MSENNQNNTNETTEIKHKGRPRIYNYPSELTCTVTGKVVKTNPLQFEHGWKQSGKSMEDYIKTYVSRTGRKEVREAQEKKDSDARKLEKAVANAAKAAAIAKAAYEKAEKAAAALSGTPVETTPAAAPVEA